MSETETNQNDGSDQDDVQLDMSWAAWPQRGPLVSTPENDR